MPTVSDQERDAISVGGDAAADESQSSPSTESPKMQVLMVDDSVAMRVMLKAQLSAWGLDVVVASDGAEAWELFQKYQMPLVLTDWMMPNMDGLELTRRIRATDVGHYVYVIILTSRSEKEDLVQAMDAGADDFLVKPCDHQELRVRLREGTRILNLEKSLATKNRELREAQAALVQSEKMAGLGQLAAGMAHEINNPVAYISNNLTVLKRDTESLFELIDRYRASLEMLRKVDPKVVEEIEKFQDEIDLPWIRENTPRMLQASIDGLNRVRDIVSNLREFARLDEADYAEVDMGDLIRSAVGLVRHLIEEKQIELIIYDDGNSTLSCRPAKINQMLHSLLLNAIQASEINGRIEIDVQADSNKVRVTISDTGAGIDPEVLPHIFEPFFTTRDVGEGTGLGLSLCYGVVQEHGGQIDVSSQPSQGTVVTLDLPKSCTPHKASEQADSEEF